MRVHHGEVPSGRPLFADRYCRTDDRIVFPAAEGRRSPLQRTERQRERQDSGPENEA